MGTIDIGHKILPIIDVSLTVLNKENALAPMQHIVHNLQMSLYWLKTAQEDLNKFLTNTLPTEDIQPEPQNKVTTIVPTLFGIKDQLLFIKNNLTVLKTELDQLNEYLSSIPSVQYKVQRAADKIHEASFNNELAINYYQQITYARTGQ